MQVQTKLAETDCPKQEMDKKPSFQIGKYVSSCNGYRFLLHLSLTKTDPKIKERRMSKSRNINGQKYGARGGDF